MTAAAFMGWLLIACGALVVSVAAACGALLAVRKIADLRHMAAARQAYEDVAVRELRAALDDWNRLARCETAFPPDIHDVFPEEER